LAPGEAYVPRYYDENWQPHYLSRADVVPSQLVNLAIPGAATVVPLDAFGRQIEPRMVRRVEPQYLTSVRPTLEPLMLTPLRNAALHSAWGRGKIDLPPGIAKKLDDRPVFVGSAPQSPRFRKDLAKALRVEQVPDKVKREKFKVRDNGGPPVISGRPEDVSRRQEADRGARDAIKNNREVERQAVQQSRQVEQQQRQAQAEQERAARRVVQQQQRVQQPRGERVGNPGRPEIQRGRQDVPRAREPQARPQVFNQPQRVQQQPQRVQQQPQAQKPDKAERHGPPAGGGGGGGQGQGGGKGKGKGKP
jgi:hypothetical protein